MNNDYVCDDVHAKFTYIYITYIRIITVRWSEAGSYLADLITGVLIGAASLPVTPTTEH